MHYLRVFIIGILLAVAPCVAYADEPLPIPRFVSLKASETYMRTGPGVRYPIKWVYHKQDMPVEVIAEYDGWRKVRDYTGETGWIHKSLLSGERFVIVAQKKAVFHHRLDEDSPAIFHASRGVTGELLECQNAWCRVQIEGMKGWVQDTALWGIRHE